MSKTKRILTIFVVVVMSLSFMACNSNINEATEAPYESAEDIILTDLSYGDDEINKYDLYIPANASKETEVGVILFVHGGSWTSGSKEDAAIDCVRYSEAGYITATMNYTLAVGSKENTAYKMVDEIKACVESIKEELIGRSYNVTKMAIGGASAGGHIASLFAYSKADVSALPVVLLIDIVGPSDMHIDTWGSGLATSLTSMLVGKEITTEQMTNGEAEELINSISPVYFVSSNSCPTVLAYGGKDPLVGQVHHEKLTAALEDAGVDYKLLIFPNSGHGLEADEDMTEELVNTVKTYLYKYFGY